MIGSKQPQTSPFLKPFLFLACIPLNLHIAHASDKIKIDVDKNYNVIYDKGAASNEVSPEYDGDYGEGAYDENYDYRRLDENNIFLCFPIVKLVVDDCC